MIHHHVHKSSHSVTPLGQINLVFLFSHHIYLRAVSILSTYQCLGLPDYYISSDFLHIILCASHSFCINATCNMQLALFDLVTLITHWLKSTNQEAIHHTVFFQPPITLALWGPDMSFNNPVLNILNICSFSVCQTKCYTSKINR